MPTSSIIEDIRVNNPMVLDDLKDSLAYYILNKS